MTAAQRAELRAHAACRSGDGKRRVPRFLRPVPRVAQRRLKVRGLPLVNTQLADSPFGKENGQPESAPHRPLVARRLVISAQHADNEIELDGEDVLGSSPRAPLSSRVGIQG